MIRLDDYSPHFQIMPAAESNLGDSRLSWVMLYIKFDCFFFTPTLQIPQVYRTRQTTDTALNIVLDRVLWYDLIWTIHELEYGYRGQSISVMVMKEMSQVFVVFRGCWYISQYQVTDNKPNGSMCSLVDFLFRMIM